MENILDLYTQPADAYYSLVYSDKTSKRSIDEVITPQVVQLEQTLRCDYEYVHNGQHIYVFCAIFQNWRYVRVTEHCRTPIWSSGCAILVDVHFLGAKPYHRGRGSLSTHNPVALYEVFEIA